MVVDYQPLVDSISEGHAESCWKQLLLSVSQKRKRVAARVKHCVAAESDDLFFESDRQHRW
jgi:hypothetical protein